MFFKCDSIFTWSCRSAAMNHHKSSFWCRKENFTVDFLTTYALHYIAVQIWGHIAQFYFSAHIKLKNNFLLYGEMRLRRLKVIKLLRGFRSASRTSKSSKICFKKVNCTKLMVKICCANVILHFLSTTCWQQARGSVAFRSCWAGGLASL